METQTQNDISYIWTRLNRRWLLSGLISGVGAGLSMLLLASFLSLKNHQELTFPLKLIGAAVLGDQAMQIGQFGGGAFTGILIHFGLASFFGLVFAQFVAEWSRKRVLFLMGLLGGLAVWLFWATMFMPSFNEPMGFLLPKGISLILHATFGLTFGVLIVVARALFCQNKS